MEFLLYLNSHGKQLIHDLISAKFHIHENIGFCQNNVSFGYTVLPNKFVICTKNIKRQGYDPYFYINETVYHEAVHAAQICKGSALGLSVKQTPLTPDKLQNVRDSINATKNYSSEHEERESYYLEDKPKQVRYYVRKFCF